MSRMAAHQKRVSAPQEVDHKEIDEPEDDPIVHEIPVYLSQELSGNLHLLQYPLRPHDRPYTDVGPIVAARAKPKLRKVEMEYQLDDAPARYDSEADYELPRLKLSSQTVPPKTNYAVGLFRGNRVYLTPLNAVCKMLPTFDHIDQANADDRAEERPTADEPQDDLKPVLQKFKRQSERAVAVKRVTYSYLKLLQDQEPWADLEIVPQDDYECSLHRDLLTLVPQQTVEPITSATDYLDQVCPKADLFQLENDALEIKDAKKIRDNKLIEFIKSAQVASLAHICRVLEIRTLKAMNECLEILNTYFYNIQGNWVLRSEYCFPGRSVISVRRILTRNLVICLFAHSMEIDRADAVEIYPAVTTEDLTLVLKDLAVPCGDEPDPETRWRLKQPRDEEFIRRNGPLMERHLVVIQKLRKMIDNILGRNPPEQQEQQQQQPQQSQQSQQPQRR